MDRLKTTYDGVKKCTLSDYPYVLEWNDDVVFPVFEHVYSNVLEQHAKMKSDYYSNNGNGRINLGFMDHYVILFYRFANSLWKNNMEFLAEAVYYSLRIRGSIDLFYKTEIGETFVPTHALGTAMDCHAKYGKGFKIYNGCHIGPSDIVGKDPRDWVHPEFGDYVTMLSHSKVFGKSKIGNNVILSTGCVVMDEDIPDNCVVIGQSPKLYFIPLSEGENVNTR